MLSWLDGSLASARYCLQCLSCAAAFHYHFLPVICLFDRSAFILWQRKKWVNNAAHFSTTHLPIRIQSFVYVIMVMWVINLMTLLNLKRIEFFMSESLFSKHKLLFCTPICDEFCNNYIWNRSTTILPILLELAECYFWATNVFPLFYLIYFPLEQWHTRLQIKGQW